jgi:hypothetical protein
MRYYIVAILAILYLSGCSSKNAFTPYDLDSKQELALNSLKSAKIVSNGGELKGVISAIWLNSVYPEEFSGDEYFYINFFTKDDSKANFDISIDGAMPYDLVKLSDDPYAKLLGIDNSWSRGYLLRAKEPKSLKLEFSYDSHSATITFNSSSSEQVAN